MITRWLTAALLLRTTTGLAKGGRAVTKDMLLTDPAEAADFVAKTKCDALAIAIGTSHGAYKFTRKPTGEVLAISQSHIHISRCRRRA